MSVSLRWPVGMFSNNCCFHLVVGAEGLATKDTIPGNLRRTKASSPIVENVTGECFRSR